jgi:hypothetical protein
VAADPIGEAEFIFEAPKAATEELPAIGEAPVLPNPIEAVAKELELPNTTFGAGAPEEPLKDIFVAEAKRDEGLSETPNAGTGKGFTRPPSSDPLAVD